MMFSETAIDMAAHAFGEQRSELVLRTPQHCTPRDDVLGDRVLHEQVRRDDRHAGTGERILLQHAARAAPVIGVGVGKDDGRDRPLASISSVSTPRAPPQWSVWVWVKMTAATGRRPRCLT